MSSGIVLKMLFEGLTRIGQDGHAELALAESVEISPDRRRYTFRLKESYWSNGDRLKAQDVAHSWRLSLSPGYPSPASYQFYVIRNARAIKEGRMPMQDLGVKVIDDQTLEVHLEYPVPYFLELTAFHAYYPIHYQTSRHHPNWAASAGPNFVTNGPFQLTSWRHNNEIVLSKNPNYWDAQAVQLDHIRLSMIEDPNTELNLWEDGDLDWAGKPLSVGLPIDAVESLKRSGDLVIEPMVASYFYEFNVQRPPLNNVKVRKALSYAIHRQIIVDNLTQTKEEPALGLVPTAISLNPQGFFEDHAVERARELLEEGLEEEGLSLESFPTLTLIYNSNEAHHKIAQVIQQQWQKHLGISVELENYEWKVYLDKLRTHSFDIGRLSWIADFRDPINFLEIFKYLEDGSNHTQWSHPLYRQLLDQASATVDLDERRALLLQAETLLMEEMPISPLFFLTVSYVKNPRLKGEFLSGLGDIDFRWAYLEEEESP
jgi:oligopeptide transport system substrate-binding protein